MRRSIDINFDKKKKENNRSNNSGDLTKDTYMVSSGVLLGVAVGTGLAVVVGATIVVVYFYILKRREKYPQGSNNLLFVEPRSGSWLFKPAAQEQSKEAPDPCNYQQSADNRQILPSDCDDDEDGRSSSPNSSTLRPSSSSNVVMLLLDRWRNKSRRKNRYAVNHRQSARALIKVPDKLSEVLGDVLELACRAGTGSADKAGSGATGSAASKIGMVTGVAIIRGRWAQRTSRSPLSSVTTTDSTDSTTSSEQEFNALTKEQHHAVQPSSAMGATMIGESADGDYAGGTTLGHPRMAAGVVPFGSGYRSLTRNPSISSQGSLEGGGAVSGGSSVHHGSCSPRIRAFGPDGRHHQQDSFQTASSYPPSRSSRSPSPARAASLDARCASPASFTGSGGYGTASPCSQSSLSSLTTTGASSSYGSSSMGAARSGARCLSPLLIPPPTSCIISEGAGPVPPASPLGSLQPDLYQRQDGPLFLSAHNTTAGKSMGRLHLRLKYDFDRSDLRVHLIEAHDLAGSDQGGFNDPYVKLTLSPEVDTRKRQTPIHRNNPNPFFDQHFKFPVSHEQLQEKTLLLQVFDYDRFSRNDVVGSVRVAMEQLEFVSSTSSLEVWGEIAREKKPPEEIQQVLLSLSYLPSAERLTVLILKARNLFPSQQDKEILDPFVKVSLLTGDKRVKKKKTAVRKATRCPVWNEAMSFNVAAGSLASSAIEVCVLDSSSELIGGNAILGSCIVGPATGGATASEAETEAGSANQSREHWLHMTHSPRKAIAMWHTLH